MAADKYSSSFEQARSILVLGHVHHHGPSINFGDFILKEFLKESGFTKSQFFARIEYLAKLGHILVESGALTIRYYVTPEGKEYMNGKTAQHT